MEDIRLNSDLAIEVLKVLRGKDYPIPHRKTSSGTMSLFFTPDEIAAVTDLTVYNPMSSIFKDIYLLSSLKNLVIKTVGETQYKTVKPTASIGDKDLKEIYKIKSLEKLTLENQTNITKIDVSDLTNLTKLSLKRNVNLESINGLDKLDKLDRFYCYGNSSLSKINDLKEVIKKQKLTRLALEILLYIDAIGYNGMNDDPLAIDAINNLNENCKWVESYSESGNVILNTKQMTLLHETALGISSDILDISSGKKEYIIGTDMYLSKNVIYDTTGLITPNKMLKKNGVTMGPEYGTISTFNALVLNSCSCDGYTRAMQYLLKLAGIESRNVSCKAVTTKLHGINLYDFLDSKLPELDKHSMVCIKDYDNLYCDPCFNAYLYQKTNGKEYLEWTLRTKEDISKDHTLPYAENKFMNQKNSKARNELDVIAKKYMNENVKREM